MSTQYRLVQSGKTASGGCSAGQGSSEPVAPRKERWLQFRKVISLHLHELQQQHSYEKSTLLCIKPHVISEVITQVN
jgi:hypothetical protein